MKKNEIFISHSQSTARLERNTHLSSCAAIRQTTFWWSHVEVNLNTKFKSLLKWKSERKVFFGRRKKAFNPKHEIFSKKYIVQKRAGFLKHIIIRVIDNGKSHVKSQQKAESKKKRRKSHKNNIFHKSKVHLILVWMSLNLNHGGFDVIRTI